MRTIPCLRVQYEQRVDEKRKQASGGQQDQEHDKKNIEVSQDDKETTDILKLPRAAKSPKRHKFFQQETH